LTDIALDERMSNEFKANLASLKKSGKSETEKPLTFFLRSIDSINLVIAESPY
jgi:hypothetical protein